MTDPRSAAPTRAPVKATALAALVGAACAACLTPLVMHFEGKRNVAYLDPVKVLTICYGDTANVKPGQRATDAECLARLDTQLAAHAAPVLACTPGLAGHPQQLAAAVSLAYNIGAAAYCRSSVDRAFDARQWRAACDGFLAWRYAKGVALPGLLTRRRAERVTCLKDLPA